MSPIIARAESILEQLAAIREAATNAPWILREETYGDENGDPSGVAERSIKGPDYLQTGYEQYGSVSDTVCVFGFSAHNRHAANARAIVARINGWQADEDLARGMLALKCGESCEDSVEVTDCYWCRPQRELLLRWCERWEEVLKGVA